MELEKLVASFLSEPDVESKDLRVSVSFEFDWGSVPGFQGGHRRPEGGPQLQPNIACFTSPAAGPGAC